MTNEETTEIPVVPEPSVAAPAPKKKRNIGKVLSIATIAAGVACVLGATFGAGVLVGSESHHHHHGQERGAMMMHHQQWQGDQGWNRGDQRDQRDQRDRGWDHGDHNWDRGHGDHGGTATPQPPTPQSRPS